MSFASIPSPDAGANQDFIVATSDAVVVLDGASVPAGLDIGCRHGTPWFVRQLGTRLLATVLEDPPPSLAEALAGAIEDATRLHQDTCDLDQPEVPAATVAVVRERKPALDYLVLGDSTILLETPGGVETITDARIDRVAEAQRSAIHQHPTGSAAGRQAWTDYTIELRQHRNRVAGFWIASTDPEAARHALTGTVALDDLRRVAVLTDGATRLVDGFRLLDPIGLLNVLDEDGPEALIRATRRAEVADPTGRRWPRSKRHDDATAALCRFDPTDR